MENELPPREGESAYHSPLEPAAFGDAIIGDMTLCKSIAISLKRIADNSDATRALLEAQVKNSDEIARQLRGGPPFTPSVHRGESQ